MESATQETLGARRRGGRQRSVGRRRDAAAVDVATRPRRGEYGAALAVVLGSGAVGGAVGGPPADLLGDLHRGDRRRDPGGRPGPGRSLRAPPERREDAGNLCLVEGLLVEQLQHQRVENVAVLLEDV